MGFLAGQVEHIHDMEEEALQTEGVDLMEGNAELTWTLRPAEPRAESGRLSDTVQEQLRQLGYVE